MIWAPFRLVVGFFLHFQVKGQENFRQIKKKQYIIIANHFGYLDAFLVSAVIPFFHFLGTNFRYMTTPKWIELYPFIKYFGAYPIYRKLETIEKTLEETENLIKTGKSLLIFPVGGFPKDGQKPLAKQGVAYLSKKYNLQVIPVVLHGSDSINGNESLDVKKFFSRHYNVHARVGKPFYYSDIAKSGDSYQEVAQKMMENVNSML